MVIGNSMVSMQASHTYTSVDVTTFSSTIRAASTGFTPDSATESKSAAPNSPTSQNRPAITTLRELKMYLLEQLTKSLEERRWQRCCFGSGMNGILPVATPSLPSAGFIRQTTISHYYEETEVTEFATTGTAFTEDGRELHFGVHFEMSHSFSTTELDYMEEAVQFCDPLVINFRGDPTSLTDRFFYFDLDGDGREEKLHSLADGSGLLSLDLNNDGKINDGSELFGAQSSNGFAELARYDLDGNGWIDEADDIFDRLTVLTRNEDGTDTLRPLRSFGIGAICLANASTEFALKDAANNIDGVIRRTGMFLFENGMAGTLQQVDFAM